MNSYSNNHMSEYSFAFAPKKIPIVAYSEPGEVASPKKSGRSASPGKKEATTDTK
jgi:hypothetical protein